MSHQSYPQNVQQILRPFPGTGEAGRGSRNTLGPAHTAADALYDNAIALSQILDAWSKRDRCPALTPDARDYIRHNLTNAQANLTAIRQSLADWIDTQEQPCPANADSAAAAANANNPTPPAPPPAAPSGTNATNGSST